MKKIAVWGPNRWCNFGDDLQSVVFASHLKSLGYKPVVFMLDRGIAEEYGFATADTVGELLNGANLCIIAGGALLTPASPPKQLLLAMRRRYARDIFELHRGARKYDVRVCAISMGGDGKTRNRWFWYDWPRNLFFASDRFIDGTVRLKGDVKQMKKFGKEFKYFPDCLFSIRRFLNIAGSPEKKQGDPIRIGFNLRERHLSESFLKEIHDYAASRADMKFYFATTHMDKAIEKYGTTYEYFPEQDTDNLKFVHYETPGRLLQFVADMNVFVASKLHLGLLGLLAGTPFISYRGMGKAVTFLRSIGGDAAILDDDVTFESLAAPDGLLRKPKTELMKMYDLGRLQRMVDESWQHFEFCTEIARTYA